MWKFTGKNSPEHIVISPLNILVMSKNNYPLSEQNCHLITGFAPVFDWQSS